MFVVTVTVSRECYDEVKRYLRDKEVNSQVFSKLTIEGNTGDMYAMCSLYLCANLSHAYFFHGLLIKRSTRKKLAACI